MAEKPRVMLKKKPQKGKLNKFGKKSKRFADVKSFKLPARTCAIYSAVVGGNPSATVAGPGLAISPPAPAGTTNRTQFMGVYTAYMNSVYTPQLVNLFDRYKIVGVKLKFIPQWNMINIEGKPIAPEMKIVYDFDDAQVTNQTVAQIWARRGKVFRLDKPVTVYYKPRVPFNVYSLTNPTAFTSSKAPYINQVYQDVPHFGLKFAIRDWYTTTTQGQNIQMRVEAQYYVSLREQLNPEAVDLNLYDENGELIVDVDDDRGDTNDGAPKS